MDDCFLGFTIFLDLCGLCIVQPILEPSLSLLTVPEKTDIEAQRVGSETYGHGISIFGLRFSVTGFALKSYFS
jgi:hypothetical protein